MFCSRAAFALTLSLVAPALIACGSSGRSLNSTGGTSSGGTGNTGNKGGTTSTGGKTSGGGAGGAAGSATGGAGGTIDYSSCPADPGTANDFLLYNGTPNTAGTCDNKINLPRNGDWFHYHDSTVADTAAGAQTAGAELKGRGTAPDCAYHTTGSGYTDYGAGVGFSLNHSGALDCPIDGTRFLGMSFYVKGTTDGTRSTGYKLTPNTVHVKFVTTTDRGGDDYGGFCSTGAGTDWTLCTVQFGDATREGWNSKIPSTTDKFDLKNLQKIQLQFDRESSSASVSFDVWFDDVTFD